MLMHMARGPRPKGNVMVEWSPEFAYAIGLITADGCLSKDGRHIDLTSKDRQQIILFRKCLGIESKISRKRSGAGTLAYFVQFSDVLFYRFLLGIGLFPAKSKTLAAVAVPDRFFPDFLRGYFDGDGSVFAYQDPVFENSYRFYISFTSASPRFLSWLQARIVAAAGIRGFINTNGRGAAYAQLKYAKADSLRLSAYMYYEKGLPCLQRKYLKIKRSWAIIGATPRW